MLKPKKYKLARRLGPGVFEKTQTDKFVLRETRRGAKRGMQQRRRRAPSEYGKQLLEKQKIRVTYGISERQFRRYVENAIQEREKSEEKLIGLLESRLDNIVFRLGFAPSRRAARQMVSHGHITVNGKRTRVPSYYVSVGDTIAVREGSIQKTVFEIARERMKEYTAPTWLKRGKAEFEATLEKAPELSPSDTSLDPTSVIEFYSR